MTSVCPLGPQAKTQDREEKVRYIDLYKYLKKCRCLNTTYETLIQIFLRF